MTQTETKRDWQGLGEMRDGLGKVGAGAASTASEARSKYTGLVGRAGDKAASVVGRGARAADRAMGDLPWRLGGLDERGRRIARGVLTEVVPRTAGDRVSSMLDGLAIKAGSGGVGLLLRVPLKPVIVPVLAVLGAIETVKAVKEVRQGIKDVADRVDAEMGVKAVG